VSEFSEEEATPAENRLFRTLAIGIDIVNQCCGSMTFLGDPDPAIFVIDLPVDPDPQHCCKLDFIITQIRR
jgi:hypothetical protein